MRSMIGPSDEIEMNTNPLSSALSRIDEDIDEDIDEEENNNKKESYYETAKNPIKIIIDIVYDIRSLMARAGYYILSSMPAMLKSINPLKSIIVLLFLLRNNKVSLFWKIRNNNYTEEDYEKEEQNPIAVRCIEQYIDVFNYFDDVINYFLRLLSNRVPNSKIKRKKLVKDHLLQGNTHLLS